MEQIVEREQALANVEAAELEQVVENDMPISYGIDELIEMARMAEEMVRLNKVIEKAVPKLTRAKSWVILGGKPYLLADAAESIAFQFGIGWQLIREEKFSDAGYPAFKFTYRFTKNSRSIEIFGGRSGKEEFFSGKGNWKKKPDEVDWMDVEKAAETNAINRGLRIMLPGFANLDVNDLEAAGLNISGESAGVAYKEGNQGGKTQAQKNDGLKCESCGSDIDQKVASYSKSKYGKHLCRSCQRNPGAIVVPVEEQVPEEPEWMREAPQAWE